MGSMCLGPWNVFGFHEKDTEKGEQLLGAGPAPLREGFLFPEATLRSCWGCVGPARPSTGILVGQGR